MKAIMKTKEEKGFEIREIPEPEIQHGNEVKLKVDVASICGTDYHMWVYDKWAQNRLPPAIPFVAGHEAGLEVVDIGPDVKNLKIGDKVSMECHEACGTCYQCRSDRQHICSKTKIFGVDKDGIFSEYESAQSIAGMICVHCVHFIRQRVKYGFYIENSVVRVIKSIFQC